MLKNHKGSPLSVFRHCETLAKSQRKAAYNCVVFLDATKGQVNYTKMSRTTAEIRNQEPTTFDRFIALGVDCSAHVLLIFTKNKSMCLLTYKIINPGTPVYLLCPRVLEFPKDTKYLMFSRSPNPCVRLNVFELFPADVKLPSIEF